MTEHPGQWRLDRIELVNWGTFHGHHVMEVPRQGFLLTGHSGSGKSSVVDAMTAVLTPRMRTTFNAAAADGSSRGQDRTVLTYVRGAHSRGADEDTGEITTQYLRPPRDASGRESGGTWSGVLLRYSTAEGRRQHLVKLFHAKRGAAAPADVSELHMITAEHIDLLDLQPYAMNGLRERDLKKDRSEAFVHKQHARFSARFSRDLGIVGERATLLLHRTQAAKNLGSLDDLFRDFMLDEPETFALADRAVDQFTELSEAHQAVVRAREQISHLEPLEQDAAEYDAAAGAQVRAEHLLESLEDFTRSWKLELTAGARDAAADAVTAADSAQREAQAALSAADQRVRDAVAVVDARGGAQLEALQERIAARAERAQDAHRRHESLHRMLEDAQMPAPEKSLPFAAELLQVREDSAEWSGAIERVLRPLGTVMLVPAAHEFAVSAAADAHHLGTSMRFNTVPAESPAPAKPGGEDSLVYRVEVSEAASSPVRDWLHFELARRYDYACVDRAEQLGEVDRGVTRAGQVKRAPRRFEKDDTYEVSDRSRWILGFSNDAKIEHYLQLRKQAEQKVAAIDEELGAAIRTQHAHQARLRALEEVQRISWEEVDAEARASELAEAEQARTRLLAGDGDLRAAQKQLEQAQRQRSEAAEGQGTAFRMLASAQAELETLQKALEQLRSSTPVELDEETSSALRQEFAAHRTQRTVTHSSIEADARQVTRALNDRIRRAADSQARTAEKIARITFEFRNYWPAAAGDLGDGVETRSGYLEVLGSLRADRLPDFEQRFFQMLREQSQQNIGLLAERIRSAPREIRRRVGPINESLLRSRFDHRGRWLQIQVKDARPAVAKEFLADLNTIASGGLSLGEETPEEMERRFEVLSRVMRQLGSSEAADRTWRRHCLDTRRHVQFLGLEKDADGAVVDYHESGRGRSGGQKQKLVVFCLAAALRYQLTRETEAIPAYGSIVMDEAFDKADARFTRMALDIFGEFGFHMILATPLKMLQVLEDYVGGIALVTSPDGRHSYLSPVSIDDERLAAGRQERGASEERDTAQTGPAQTGPEQADSGQTVAGQMDSWQNGRTADETGSPEAEAGNSEHQALFEVD